MGLMVHDRAAPDRGRQPAAEAPRHVSALAQSMLRLQATVGNRAVQRMLKRQGRVLARDLAAYNRERSEWSTDSDGAGSTVTTESAEAAGIRSALSKLIEKGKVSETRSKSGAKSWFAANHHRDAQLDDIRKAFEDAGYGHADKLARALYDIHGEYLYGNTTSTTYVLFWDFSSSTGRRLWKQRNRDMTEYEIRQAKRVFKDAIDYTKVEIRDGSLSAKVGSVGGYARTIGNAIHYPDGASRNMGLMIHELTHVWQYQKQGWTYAPEALWAQVTEGYSYSDGKTPKEALEDARAAGRKLQDFNLEQQGDVLADYFRRLQQGSDVTAWQPFVNDVN